MSYPTPSSKSWKSSRSRERRTVAQEIRKHLEAEGSQEHLQDFAYLHHKPAEELVSLAAKSKGDVIVMAAESGLLNLSRLHRGYLAHTVTEAHCPVLVIPAL